MLTFIEFGYSTTKRFDWNRIPKKKNSKMCNILAKKAHPFFCRFKKVIESPYPLKASSGKTVILFERRSRCRKRCKGRKASVGIWWILLSPNRRYCRFSSHFINELKERKKNISSIYFCRQQTHKNKKIKHLNTNTKQLFF